MTDNTDTLSTYKKKAIANAQRAHSYGGKRFLGFTPKGAEVWVSMFVDRDTLELKVNCTHDLNILLKKGSRLANRRVVVKKGVQTNESAEDLLRSSQRNMGGDVTIQTLRHIQRLINAVDMKYTKAYVGKKPSSLLFNYVANAIFSGTFDMERGDTSWGYIINEFPFPKGGEYFTVESIPLFAGQIVEEVEELEDILV